VSRSLTGSESELLTWLLSELSSLNGDVPTSRASLSTGRITARERVAVVIYN